VETDKGGPSSHWPAAPEAACPPIAVRETRCKTILNRSSLGDYSLNCYTGCAHGCLYCYARFMQRFHPHPEPWGRFVDIKINAVEALERQLPRLRPGAVFVSSACDGWQPLEAEWKLTRRCCELLLRLGFRVNALTKSALILRDLEVFAGREAQVGVTVTTLEEGLKALWEPGASSVEERLRVLAEARRAGIETSIMFGPLLPFLSDGQDSLDLLFRRAAELKVGRVWVDALNPRPRVWPALAGFLSREYPGLRETYRKLLFDPQERAAYLERLRTRVTRAASRAGLEDRLESCP